MLTGKPGRKDAEQPLLMWHREAVLADWASPANVKRQHGSASILKNSRVVFNVAGNKYRLVTFVPSGPRETTRRP
jgi:mRNA interferase HigB